MLRSYVCSGSDLGCDGILGLKEMNEASQYLAKKTLGAVEQMFSGARHLMEWLRACAGIIVSKAVLPTSPLTYVIHHVCLNVQTKAGQPVSWVSPLGLPIMQPYRKTHSLTVQTVMQQVGPASCRYAFSTSSTMDSNYNCLPCRTDEAITRRRRVPGGYNAPIVGFPS